MAGDQKDPCAGKLTPIDAFLYGLPAGLVFAGFLLFCFMAVGRALTTRKVREREPSVSSNTRRTKNLLGKRKRRGPPPSSQLKPVDIMAMANQESAPDDIKQLAQAAKITQTNESEKTISGPLLKVQSDSF